MPGARDRVVFLTLLEPLTSSKTSAVADTSFRRRLPYTARELKTIGTSALVECVNEGLLRQLQAMDICRECEHNRLNGKKCVVRRFYFQWGNLGSP
jgi:hypothetical protein